MKAIEQTGGIYWQEDELGEAGGEKGHCHIIGEQVAFEKRWLSSE